jgi:hypothetical protein
MEGKNFFFITISLAVNYDYEQTQFHMTFPPLAQRKIQFLPLSAGQIGVRLIHILCLFSNQLFT